MSQLAEELSLKTNEILALRNEISILKTKWNLDEIETL